MVKHHHRSGPLKQSNKKNKRSKASKRSQSRLAGGKVETSSSGGGGSNRRAAFKSNASHVQQKKADRKHQLQQKRQSKRDEALRKRRGITAGTANSAAGIGSSRYQKLFVGNPPIPPRVVGIINLGRRSVDGSTNEDDMEQRLRNLIVGEADWTSSSSSSSSSPNGSSISEVHPNVVTAKFDKHKKDGYLTILTTSMDSRSLKNVENESSDDDDAVFAALDLCRVCDLVLFVVDADASQQGEEILGMNIGNHDDRSSKTNKSSSSTQQQNDYDHLISECGDKILSAVKSQGLPEVITVLARTASSSTGGGDDSGHDDDDYMSAHSTKSAKSIRRANLKHKTEVKKYISRFANTEFGANNDKVMEVNLAAVNNIDTPRSAADAEDNDDDAQMDQDETTDKASGILTSPTSVVVDHATHSQRILASSLVRALCSTSASPANWVSGLPRSYMLAEGHSFDPEQRELHITGYVRGLAPFDVNALVHVPGMGTYACKSLRPATNPLNQHRQANKKKSKQAQIDDTMEEDIDDDFGVVESDPMKRESLERFATPDALEGEQNLVGFDEVDEYHDGEMKGTNDKNDDGAGFARPAGWSDYQSAWLDAVDQNDVDQEDFDHGELAKELNTKSSASVATKGMDLDDANDVTPEERQALIEQRRKQQQEHQEFPDEVQVNDDEKARERFARYRSLKSFKKSYWDPKENLPEDYASIYNFSSFKTTQRAVMAEMRDLVKESEDCGGIFWDGKLKDDRRSSEEAMNDDSDEDDDFLEGCIPSGSYVTLTLEGVNKLDYDARPSCPIMTAVILLPHENKVSMLHMGLSSNKDASSSIPVKSKDSLIFRCGWRTWTGRPIFSQNNLNCDKHKFERYMPEDSFFAASVFGPVTYTPCPVLVFRELDGKKEFVASGSMIGADADRIVVKRIILTGYPVRVHKRFATVKYMFYDPEDVKWFKPAGLTTKHGLNGKIEESVGEHGTMKCLFNAPIKQHDTVCLCLYKRVYPKLGTARDKDVNDERTVRTTICKKSLVVK